MNTGDKYSVSHIKGHAQKSREIKKIKKCVFGTDFITFRGMYIRVTTGNIHTGCDQSKIYRV